VGTKQLQKETLMKYRISLTTNIGTRVLFRTQRLEAAKAAFDAAWMSLGFKYQERPSKYLEMATGPSSCLKLEERE